MITGDVPRKMRIVEIGMIMPLKRNFLLLDTNASVMKPIKAARRVVRNRLFGRNEWYTHQ